MQQQRTDVCTLGLDGFSGLSRGVVLANVLMGGRVISVQDSSRYFVTMSTGSFSFSGGCASVGYFQLCFRKGVSVLILLRPDRNSIDHASQAVSLPHIFHLFIYNVTSPTE